MRSVLIGLAAVTSALCAPSAYAVDVASGSVSLTSADLQQFGRLSRNAVPQDWAGDEIYPGEINSGTAYSYATLGISFAPNATQDVYYDITFDDVASDLFASAYLGSYDPANKALNWLGDAGTSGNYFGTDALFFDVVVPAGQTLLLVFNSTNNTGPTSTANYFVQAFSDSEYDENFPQAPGVPEPAGWAMMLVGFGAVGGLMRGRRKTAITFA
jgi:hypothetical protein